VLHESGQFNVIGEREFTRILTLERASRRDDMNPRASVVADRLIVEYGLSVVPHLIDVFPGSPVLVHGDHETTETCGQIIAAGASGYFDLSAPSEYLVEAVTTVSQGMMWAPRQAVALLAQRMERGDNLVTPIEPPVFSDDDLLILRYLHEGLSNREIGARLELAEWTVTARLDSLYRSFGVTTPLQLLSAATKTGLVV
jgi:DNA-binding NarL/FixJ family response regulator